MRPDGFFIGLHQPSDGKHFPRACISINRLRGPYGRKAPLPAQLREVFIDCAGFTELFDHGRYRHSVREYADDCVKWCADGRVVCIVAQDYMCEPVMLAKTGLTVAEHQRLTIERYLELKAYWYGDLGQTTYVLPVLQGWTADDYVTHLKTYGDLIGPGAWVGVGSVCKRQGSPKEIVKIMRAIKAERPDIRIHAFGVKTTSLLDPEVRALIDTADSNAWSYSARKQGRSANDWREAKAFADRIEGIAA